MDACAIKTGPKIEIEYDENNKEEGYLIKRSWIFGNGAADKMDFRLVIDKGGEPQHILLANNNKEK